MKTLKFIFITLFLTGIISCKKTENTSVKALVFDEISQQYVPNRKIVLYEVRKEIALIHPKYTRQILKEVYTDAYGIADFGAFETKRNNKYTYFVKEDGIDPYDNSSNVKKGENNTIEFKVSASADIIVKFIPPPPYNSGDSLTVTFTNAKYPMNIKKIRSSNYSGHLRSFPAGYEYINIDKYKTGVYSNTKDTVFYAPSSTNEYDVYW